MREPHVQAFLHVDEQRALDQAQAVDETSPARRTPRAVGRRAHRHQGRSLRPRPADDLRQQDSPPIFGRPTMLTSSRA